MPMYSQIIVAFEHRNELVFDEDKQHCKTIDVCKQIPCCKT